MTQSGQEPPEFGRRAADVSGANETRLESSGSTRRRRKRRSGQGPKGTNAAQNPVAALPLPDLQKSVQTASGPVEKPPSSQAKPGDAAGAGLNSAKRRKKRRRGRLASTDSVGAGLSGMPGKGVEAALPAAENATSLKGKKAARRRGRKRSKGTNAAAAGHPGQRSVSPDNGTAAKPENNELHSQANPALEKGAKRPVSRRINDDGTPSPGRRHSPRGDLAGSSRRDAPLYAALDLGTNNCRLLIARPEERGFRVIDAYSRIVRLGEGVGSNRRLSDAAMDRAIEALDNCHRKLADRGVVRSRLIATEACRAAENGAEFIERVKSETGLALEIVNRETEARLAVAGCATLVDHDADGVILFDIGGGSSEIVWLDLRNRCGARGYALTRFIRSWISLPVGVVNLAERHGGVHVTPDVFEAMVEDAAEHLAAFSLANNLTEAISSGKVHMLGTSGTVTTLAGVHLGLKRYDRRRVDGTWLENGDVTRMIDHLRDMPYEARVENPCIGEDRADLVLAGCAILEAIRRRWSCSRLRVADRGLREGILTELMAADGVWANRHAGRRSRSRQRNKT